MHRTSFPFLIRFSCIAIIALCLYSCENKLDTVNLITAKDQTPLGSEQNASIVYTDSAKIKFKLNAPEIERYGGPDPYQVAPKGVTVDFYNDSMSINGYITANYAIRHEKTDIMEADNNVVMVNKKGDRLNTEQLFWNENTHRIYTNKYVEITTSSEIIYGDGLESNEDFTQYTITNIRGTIVLNTPAPAAK